MQPGLVIATTTRPAWFEAIAGATAAWIAAERGRFALWLPVFMLAGVLGYFSLTFEPPWWIGLSSTVVALLLGWQAGPRPALRAPCWAVAAAAVGLASA